MSFRHQISISCVVALRYIKKCASQGAIGKWDLLLNEFPAEEIFWQSLSDFLKEF